MSIRQLVAASTGLALLGSLGAIAWAPAQAQNTPVSAASAATPDQAAVGHTLRLAEVLQAARQNPDALAAQRALEAARADVRAADRAPAPVLRA